MNWFKYRVTLKQIQRTYPSNGISTTWTLGQKSGRSWRMKQKALRPTFHPLFELMARWSAGQRIVLVVKKSPVCSTSFLPVSIASLSSFFPCSPHRLLLLFLPLLRLLQLLLPYLVLFACPKTTNRCTWKASLIGVYFASISPFPSLHERSALHCILAFLFLLWPAIYRHFLTPWCCRSSGSRAQL